MFNMLGWDRDGLLSMHDLSTTIVPDAHADSEDGFAVIDLEAFSHMMCIFDDY